MSFFAHRDFERKCLKAHNKYRALHGTPPLQLDDELTDEANSWAEELTTLRNLRHSPNPCVGENIYTVRAANLSGDVPVRIWYDEIKNYDFDRPCECLRAIHFTQLIWKQTRRLGVGYARRGMLFIVVVNYDPPGNILGEFRENVPTRILWNDIGSISSDSLSESSETSLGDKSLSMIPSQSSASISSTRYSVSEETLTKSISSQDDSDEYERKPELKIREDFNNSRKVVVPKNIKQNDMETYMTPYTIFDDSMEGIIVSSPLRHDGSYEELRRHWIDSTSGDAYQNYSPKPDIDINKLQAQGLPAEYTFLLLLILAIGGVVGGFIYYNR